MTHRETPIWAATRAEIESRPRQTRAEWIADMQSIGRWTPRDALRESVRIARQQIDDEMDRRVRTRSERNRAEAKYWMRNEAEVGGQSTLAVRYREWFRLELIGIEQFGMGPVAP